MGELLNCPVKQDKQMPVTEYYRELTTGDVMELVGLKTRQSVWRWVKQNKLPSPRYAAPHAPRWYLGEVLEHRQQNTQHFADAPRGLKGQVASENPNEAKVGRLLERFGLKKPV